MAPTRYRCGHCGTEFEAEDSAVRCPSCLRRTAVAPIEEIAAPSGTRRRRRRRFGAPHVVRSTLVVSLLLGIAILVALHTLGRPASPKHPEHGGVDKGPAAPAASGLQAKLAALGPDAAHLAVPWARDDAVRAVCKALGGDAQGWLAWFEGRRQAGALDRTAIPGGHAWRAPRSARALAKAVLAGKAGSVSSWEATALLYACEREAGATLAVRKGVPNAMTDLRRRVYGVLAGGRFIDPWGGSAENAAKADAIDEAAFVASGLAFEAMADADAGRPEVAARKLRWARKLAPDDAAVEIAEGLAKARAGGAQFGAEEIAKVLQRVPEAAGYWALAVAWDAAQSPFQAYQALQKAVDLDEHFAPAWVALATTQIKRLELVPQKQRDALLAKAREALEKAQKIDPKTPGLAAAWASVLRADGKPDEALEHLEAAVKERPDDVSLRLVYAQTLLDAGKLDEAVQQLKTAVEKDPTDEQARSMYALGVMATGRWNEAVEVWKQVIEKAPDAADVRPSLALALRNAGKRDEALRVAREQVRRFPDDAGGHLMLAQLLADQGKWEDVLAEARAASKAKASDEALVLQFVALHELGRDKEAGAALDALAKRHEGAEVDAAQDLLQQGGAEWAEKIFEHAAGRDAKSLDALVGLAVARAVLGKDEAARKAAERAVQAAPEEQRDDVRKQLDEVLRQISAQRAARGGASGAASTRHQGQPPSTGEGSAPAPATSGQGQAPSSSAAPAAGGVGKPSSAAPAMP